MLPDKEPLPVDSPFAYRHEKREEHEILTIPRRGPGGSGPA